MKIQAKTDIRLILKVTMWHVLKAKFSHSDRRGIVQLRNHAAVKIVQLRDTNNLFRACVAFMFECMRNADPQRKRNISFLKEKHSRWHNAISALCTVVYYVLVSSVHADQVARSSNEFYHQYLCASFHLSSSFL
jgi:hypothetical protein